MKEKEPGRPSFVFRHAVVLQSLFDNRFYFCPKVKVLDDGVCEVVGRKFDVTEHLQPYLLKKYRRKE